MFFYIYIYINVTFGIFFFNFNIIVVVIKPVFATFVRFLQNHHSQFERLEHELLQLLSCKEEDPVSKLHFGSMTIMSNSTKDSFFFSETLHRRKTIPNINDQGSKQLDKGDATKLYFCKCEVF